MRPSSGPTNAIPMVAGQRPADQSEDDPELTPVEIGPSRASARSRTPITTKSAWGVHPRPDPRPQSAPAPPGSHPSPRRSNTMPERRQRDVAARPTPSAAMTCIGQVDLDTCAGRTRTGTGSSPTSRNSPAASESIAEPAEQPSERPCELLGRGSVATVYRINRASPGRDQPAHSGQCEPRRATQ